MIKETVNSGSEFYKYKNSHLIILLGVADADYCFIAMNIQAYGETVILMYLKKAICTED